MSPVWQHWSGSVGDGQLKELFVKATIIRSGRCIVEGKRVGIMMFYLGGIIVAIVVMLFVFRILKKGKGVTGQKETLQVDNRSVDEIQVRPDIEITNNLFGQIVLCIQPGEKISAGCVAYRLGKSGSTKNIAVVLRKLCKMRVLRARRGLGRHPLYSLKTGA